VSGSELPCVPERAATLAEQQASLRRVAALVATGAPSADVFAVIAREVAQMLRARLVQVWRWERDGTATVAATWGEEPNPFRVGSNWPWDDLALARAGSPGRVGSAFTDAGIGSSAAARIVVDGEPWGVIGVGLAQGAPVPDGIEEQLAEFTDLVAAAISNSAGREKLARLADEQAALRRVATLVAREAPPSDVFDAVAGELGRLLDVASTGMVRFEDDQTATLVAGWGRLGEVVPVGARLPVGGRNVISLIAQTGKPARVDDFTRAASGPIAEQAHRLKTQAAIGGPIIVAGRLWGAMIAAALEGDPLLPDTAPRLEQFTELVGTAIANTEARAELARLADEQAALRRVATRVAEEAPVDEVLIAVAEEGSGVLGRGIDAAIMRYEDDGTATVQAVRAEQPFGMYVGARLPIEGSSVTSTVFRERRSVRVEDYTAADGAIAELVRQHGERAAVGCPILVQGRVWGAVVVAYDKAASPSSRTSWPRRSRTPRPAPSSSAWRTSRRRSGGWRRSSPRLPRRLTSSTRSSSRSPSCSNRRRSV
jgi:GAF domain-containing protein